MFNIIEYEKAQPWKKGPAIQILKSLITKCEDDYKYFERTGREVDRRHYDYTKTEINYLRCLLGTLNGIPQYIDEVKKTPTLLRERDVSLLLNNMILNENHRKIVIPLIERTIGGLQNG